MIETCFGVITCVIVYDELTNPFYNTIFCNMRFLQQNDHQSNATTRLQFYSFSPVTDLDIVLVSLSILWVLKIQQSIYILFLSNYTEQ